MRIYPVATASSPEIRAARVRQARREFEILEGIDHPGILKVKDYKETELGPALIFDHDPQAMRLDHLLRDQGQDLSISQRLQWVRDIAETLKYAHSKRLYHRALGPQSIFVDGADIVTAESVPFLPALRYTETGLRKRAQWESPRALQRREDAGKTVGKIPVLPKYQGKDFLKTNFWRLRGGLDVPKELDQLPRR